MAILFDSTTKRIVLDVASVTATEIYSRWVDWVATGDNSKYLPAFRSLGGDDLGGGISVPAYYFLINGWRVRPMESNHTLTLTGNLFVDGGGDPIVPTLGVYNVLIKSVVPVQAQTVNVGGGVGTPTQVADAVWNALSSSYNSAGTTGSKLTSAGNSGDPWSTSLAPYVTPGTAGYELFGQRQFQTDISTQVQSITPSSTALHVQASSFHLTSGTVVSGTFNDTHTYNESEHYIRDNAGAIDFYYEFNIGLKTKPTNFNFSGYVADKHEVLSVYAYDWGTSQYEQIGEVTGVNSVANMSWALYTGHVNSSGIVRIRFASTVVSDLFAHVDQIYVGYIENVVSANEVATQVRTELTPELTHVMQVPTTSSGLTSGQATMLLEMYELLGLDPSKPLVVTATSRSAGTISQHITTDSNSTVVNRV